jgi:stage II sporulation protein B
MGTSKPSYHVHRSGIKVKVQDKPGSPLEKKAEKKSESRLNERLGAGKTEVGTGWHHEKTKTDQWRRWWEKAEAAGWNKWLIEGHKPHGVIDWGAPGKPFSRRKLGQSRFSSHIGQILLSIGGAILIGTAMGFSIMHLFFSENPVHSSNTIDDHLTVPAERGDSNQKEQVAEAAKIPLPSLRAVMLQAGNYSAKKGAMQTVQNYRAEGLAAVMSESSPYRIFMGVAPNRDDALKLSAIYQKQDVSVYLKDINVQGKIKKNDAAVALSSALEKGNRLFQQLSAVTIRDIQGDPNAQTPAFSFNSDWISLYRQFVLECQSMQKGLPEPARESLDRMCQALDQSMQSAEEAKKNPNQALLWQVQEGLVRYMVNYEQLAKDLK